MANPTTNYGFVLPTASDLVTDLPADFEVALQGVDTRLKALQPGTTLGDVAYSSATANTNTRLGIGATGTVLTVAGGVPTWAAPTSPGLVFIKNGTFTSSASTSVNTCFSSTYTNYRILVKVTGASVVSGQVRYRMRSGSTDASGANYNSQRLYAQSTSVGGSSETSQTSGIMGPFNTGQSFWSLDIFDPNVAATTGYATVSMYNNGQIDNFSGAHLVSTAYDGFTLFPDAGTITGEVWVYGYSK